MIDNLYFKYAFLILQRERGVADAVRDTRYHPGYGDLCTIRSEVADSWDRETNQGAVTTYCHNYKASTIHICLEDTDIRDRNKPEDSN